MAVNFVSYLSNIGKSITYAAVDKVKEMNPAIEEFMSTNGELSKELYAAVKDYKGTINRTKERVIKSDLYEAADVGFHAIIEDIRTGKFYNKERIDEMETRAGGSMTNYDDMGDPFAELDNTDESGGDFNWDDEPDISDDTEVIVDSVDHIGSKVTSGIAEATVRTGEMISQTNVEIAAKGQKHDTFLANKLSAGMGAINGTIAEVIKFNTDIQKPFIDRSIEFYNDIANQHKETNDLLRQIIDNQNKAIAPIMERKTDREVIDWNTLGEIPDFKEYAKLIKKNIKDQSMGIFDMFDKNTTGMDNLLLTFVASPLQKIPEAIVKYMVPKTMETVMKSLNDTMTGAFGATLARLNRMAEDEDGNIISKTLGKILGLSKASSIKNTVDINGISDRAIAWDEQSKQALVRVIPDTLAKILAAETNTAEQLYDYNTGKYVDMKSLADQYDPSKVTYDAAYASLRDMMGHIEKALSGYKISNESTLEGLKEAMKSMVVNMYRNDRVLTPEYAKYLLENPGDGNEQKLQEIIGSYDTQSVNILASVIANLVDNQDFKASIKNANASIFSQKASQRRKFEEMSTRSGAVVNNLYNGYDPNNSIIKDSSGKFITNKKGKLTDQQIQMQSLDVFDHLGYSSLAYQKETVDVLYGIRDTIGSFYGYVQSTNPYDAKLADKARTDMYHNAGLKTDEEEFIDTFKNRTDLADEEKVVVNNMIEALEAKEQLPTYTNKYTQLFEDKTRSNIEAIQELYNKRFEEWIDKLENLDYLYGEGNYEDPGMDMTDITTTTTLPTLERRVNEYKTRDKKYRELIDKINNSEINSITNVPSIDNINNRIVTNRGPIITTSSSTSVSSLLNNITRRRDKYLDQNAKAEEKNTTKELEAHNKRVEEYEKKGLHASNLDEDVLSRMYDNMDGADSNRTEGQNIYNAMTGQMQGDASYRKFISDVKEQKEKDEKLSFNRLMNYVFKTEGEIEDTDSKTKTFLQGLKELSEKPSEFMVRMIKKVDDRLYNIVFGDPTSDQLSPKSFMSQLTTRLGYIFRDFRGFLTDEVFGPIKETLFGDEGALSTASKKVKEIFDWDKLKTSDSVADFILGEKDENGKRHGGMFGDKFNFTKDSVKSVYGTLGDLLVETPDDNLSIDMQKFNKARDEYYDQDKNADGGLSGYKVSEIQELLFNTDEGKVIGNDELSKKYHDLALAKGVISADKDFTEDEDYKRIATEYRNVYGNTIEEIDLNNLILKAFVTFKLGQMGYQSAANVLQDIKSNFEEQEKFMKDKAYRKFQLSQMFDMNTDELTNFMSNREALDKRISNGEFEDPWSIQDEEERLGLRDDRWFSAGSEGQKALEQYMKDVQAARIRQKYMKDTYNNDLFIKSGILGRTDKLVYRDEFKDSHIDKALAHNNIPGMKEYIERYGSKDTGKYDYENDEEIGQYAKGGVVTKTGVIAASEGEMIIPSKYNPNYNGDTNTESNLKKESNAIDKFLQSIGVKDFKIPQYAEGGTVGEDGTGEVKPLDMPDINDDQFKYGHAKQFIINTRDRYLNKVTERRKNKYRARNYNKLSDKQKRFIDSIGYDSEEYNNLSEAEKVLFEEGKFQELIEKISTSGNRIAEGLDIVADDINGEEDYTTQKEKLFGTMMEDLKENVGKYLPSSLGSALIGGGISLVTGAVGGPLVGAAVGAAADLTVHSKSVQDWLFGEEFIDVDGNTKRKGNVLSKDLSNFITRYIPDMAKGGTVGAITSILPFVPGGPVAGLFLGAGLGFAKNNETIMSKLFGTLGEDGKRNNDGLLPPDFTDTLKKLLPEAAIGAIGGAAGGALLGGPFGLVGNMTIGAGIGILSQTDKFQDALFGTKDPSTGIRQGGLVGAIKTGFVDPLVETGTSLKDKFINWFKNDIAFPISSAIAPLAKQGGLFAGGIIKGVTSGINTIIQKELGTSFSGFGHLLHDLTKNIMTAGLGAINMTTRPVGKMISSPFRTIGRIGEHYRKRHVADGNADYMTALQRLQYRQELNDNVEYKKYDSDVVDERTGEILHRKGDVMTDGVGRPIKNKDRGFKYFHNTLRRGKMNKFFGHTDKFEEFDKTLVDMDRDELASLRNSLEYLKNPNQGSTLLRNEAVSKINDTVHSKYGFSHSQSQKLLNILKNKGLESARRYISSLGMSETDERELMNVLTQNYSVYEASNEINSRSSVLRRNLMSNLRDMGLKGMTESNIDKHLNYVNQELKLKEDQNPIDKLNEKQEERHKQIINLFESAVDQLKILNGTESVKSISKKYAKRNKAFAETKSTMMGLTEKLIGRTGVNEEFNIANSNAIWGANYEIDNEVSEDGKHIKWFMVNKQNPSIRIEVDSNGNPVNSEDMSLVSNLNYRRNGIIRSGFGKAKNKVKTVASNAWNLGMAERRNRRNTKFDSKMEDQFREEYEKLYNKYKDYIDLPTIDDKGENESWREFYERVLNLLKSESFDNEKMMTKDRRLHNKFFKNYLHRRGIHTSKARFGKYRDENGNKIGLKEQYEHARDLEDQYGLNGQGKIVGEEQDELGKRMTVSDLFGNPIQLIKSRDGRWIKNPNDSENKQASWLHDKLLGLGDKVGGVLSNIGTDIKDGFNHLFNIDTEKDGWLKTLLKVGTGILGTMTAVSAMPAMEAWWQDSIKPAIGEFWQVKVLPKISGVLEPIKPYIARAAIGIDMAIRSIPDSIGVLGDRIKGFITEDLPQIWSNKILPFYQNGYNWAIEKVSSIVENGVYLAIKAFPAIISGAIKGATKFLTTDIFTIFGGLGRRDSESIMSSLSSANGVPTSATTINEKVQGLSNFNGASKFASALIGSNVYDYYTGNNVDQNTIADWYESGNSRSGYPANVIKPYQSNQSSTGTNISDDPLTGYENGYEQNSGTLESNYDALMAYSESIASQGYSVPTASNNASYQINNAVVEENTKEIGSLLSGIKNKVSGVKAKVSNSIGNYVNRGIATTSTKVVDSSVPSSLVFNSTSVADRIAAEEQAKLDNKKYNKMSSSELSKLGDTNTQVSYGKYNYYNTDSAINSGSSAGISLNGAQYDPNTGLVMSASGKFIPNAFYDPKTGMISSTPTKAAIKAYPNIQEMHDTVLQMNLESGDISYKDLLGANYIADNDPYYREGDDNKVAGSLTMSNLRDSKDNIVEMLNNEDSLGRRFLGTSYNNGLNRVLLTGNAGVIGKGLNKLGTFGLKSKGPIGKLVGGTVRGTSKVATGLTNFAKNHSLAGLSTRINYNNALLNQLKTQGAVNAVDNVANGIRSAFPKIARNTDSMSNASRKAWNKYVKNTVNSVADVGARANMKAAQGVVDVASSANGQKFLKITSEAAEKSDGLIAKLGSKIKTCIANLIKSNEYRAAVSALAKEGLDADTIAKGLQEGSDDIVKAVERALAKTTQSGGKSVLKKVGAKIGRFLPFIGPALFITDFIKGFNDTPTYLGISSEQMDTLDFSPLLLRIVVGLAYALDNYFLLGLVPMETMVDLFVEILLPLFNVDTSSLMEARNETANQLEAFKVQSGNEDATVKDLNDSKKWTTKLWNTLTGKKDTKTKMSESEANSILESRKAALNLDAVKHGNYSYNPNANNALFNNTFSVSSYMTDMHSNLNSTKTGKGSHLRLENEDPLEKQLPKYDSKYQNKRITPYTFNPAKAKYPTGKGSNIPYTDSPIYKMSWDNEPKKSYIGAGSGIANTFDTTIDMRSSMLKYNIDGAGSGNINHAYSSIGSIADLPQDNTILQRRYIGAGSGIKPVSSKATVHFYAGKATPTVQATGGADIISESAKLIVKVETNGDIAHMEVDSNNCYSIGSACWNNSRAASLLKAIVKKGGAASKKALGNDLYNQINNNTQFKNNTYSKASLSKIKKVLASQESRDVQSKQLASDIAGYVNIIKKKFSDPKVIIFLTAYIHQYGAGGLNNLNIKGDSNISIDAFFKQFKELSPYKNYKSRYDTAYSVAANSTCSSANVNNANYDAINANLGVSEATVQNISDSEKNAKSNGSFTELFSSMSDAFKALFGIGSSSSKSAKAKQAAGKQDEYVEGVTSILGENVLPSEEVVDSIVGVALTREEIDDLASKMNDINFTLLERLNYLKQIYTSDPSVAVEYLANSTLLELLLYSRIVQKTLKISKYNGKYKEYHEAWDSPKYGRNIEKLEKLQEKINSIKQFVKPSNPNAHTIYFTDRNSLRQNFELLDTHVELLVKDVEGLCNKVFKEFKELANNPYAMECAENLQTVMSGFRNAYAVSDIKAKKLEILKSVFKCNTPFYKELKKNFNNREVTITFLDDYINSGQVISDYNEGKFLSAQDRLYRDLEVSFAALDKKDSTLEEKEVAWDSATGIMAELLGLDRSDVALTYDAVQKASNKPFVNERASDLLAKNPDIDKDILRDPNKAINNFFNPPADVSNFKGLSKLATQTELKKNKTILEDIKYINSKYPNVHDFDVLFSGKDIIDRFNTFNDTNTRGATSKIATFSGMPNSLRQFATIMNEKNRMYTPQELADNYYNIINSISADSYKSANVYNPYTFKRLINMKNLLDIESKSPYGPKYKEIMNRFVQDYIYNQDQTYTGDPDKIIAGLFNTNTLGSENRKVITAQDIIDTNKEYGMEGFIDYYKAYLSDANRVANEFSYDKLGKDIDLIKSYLPDAQKNLKIEGKDVDYDNYVYAKALYEAYQNKINKMQEEDYKGRYLSKRNQKKFEKAFQEYLNFESRKAALLRQPYNEALKSFSTDSNITFKELVPDTKSVDEYFSGMISNVPTQNTEAYDAEGADKGKEEVTDNKEVTIGTMLLAQSNGGPGSPEAMIDTMLDKYLKNKTQRAEAKKKKKERKKENANKPKKVNGYIIDTEEKKAEKATNINPDTPYDGSYESAHNFWNGVKNLGKKISNWWNGDKEDSKEEGKGSELTAKGNEFISQLDYANTKFSDGESLAEAGCGPAVAAMAINGLSGKASMMDTAKIADKYKTTGGTDASYFKDVFNRVGANTTYYEGSKASSESAKSLKAGQQVVLLGQDKSNKSKEKSPFGPGNHYVLAKGMANGKVAINDPEQHGTKIYNKDILNKTKLGIAISGKGSDTSYVGGASQFPTYALNEQQIKGAANIIAHEQSGTAARYAEASLMANLVDIDGTGTVDEFVSKLQLPPGKNWFRDGAARFNNPPAHIDQSAIDAVNDVIVKGYRTLPRYIDEHDCFSDFDSVTNNGKSIKITDRSSYIPNTTRLHNSYGSDWTFYTFPDSKSDPFGYTDWRGKPAREKYGEAHFDLNKNPVNGATVPTGDSVTGTISTTDTTETKPQGFVAEMTQAFKDVANSLMGQFSGDAIETTPVSMTTTSDGTFQSTGQFGEDVVNYARTFIGKLKYVYGGTSLTTGADCSGFCQQIYKKFGINLPRTARAQAAWNRGTKITDKSQLDKGDLVFFGTPNDVHHVGIYSGNNTYIHAPETGRKVEESPFTRSDFVWGRRVSALGSSDAIAAGSNIVDKLNDLVAKGSEIKPSPSNKTLDKIERSAKANQPIIKNKVVKAKPTTVKKRPTVQDAIDSNNYGKITKKKVVIGVDPTKQKSSYTGGASTLSTDQKAKLGKSKGNIATNKITPLKKSVETFSQDNTMLINLLKTIVTLLADISANSQNSKDILKILTKIYNLKSDKEENTKKVKTVEKTKKKRKSGKGSELDDDPVIDTSYNNPNVIIPQIASTTQSVMNNHNNSDYDDINSLIQDLVKVLS